MTKDDILQALRLTAMGRTGHELQEQLAEKLAELFADRAKRIAWHDEELQAEGFVVTEIVTDAQRVSTEQTSQMLSPKRRKKAD